MKRCKPAKNPTPLEQMYAGIPAYFHSPFDDTPGYDDGDLIILVRQVLLGRDKLVDPEIGDLWIGENLFTGEQQELWGGEAWLDDKRPLVPQHRFLNWKTASAMVRSADKLRKRNGIEKGSEFARDRSHERKG